jgi:signal transduction histidine kinase
VAHTDTERHGPDGAAELAPRLAFLAVAVVFAGFMINAMQYVLEQDTSVAHVGPALCCLVLMMVLQLAVFSNPRVRLRGRWGYLALLVQAAVVLVPVVPYGQGWTGLQGFLAGDALLTLRPRIGWPVFAVVVLGAAHLQYQLNNAPLEVAYVGNLTAVMGLVVFGLSRLRSLVQELERARVALASLAVARERLRFARDLHDLLGLSLSAITLKAELAHRLVASDPARARRELADVGGICAQAATEARAVASSYRELSFHEELASARRTLATAGVTVTVDGGAGDLPPPVATVLATVLREGVTNLLRHSDATRCAITVEEHHGVASVEVLNDGVRTAGSAAGGGTGVDNLRSRVTALGGTLSAEVAGDTYRLRAEVPVRQLDKAPSSHAPHLPDLGPATPPRLGAAIAAAVFVGYAVNAVMFAFYARLSPGGTLLALLSVLTSVVCVLGFFSRPACRPRSAPGFALLAVLGLATYAPVVLLGNPVLGMPGLLAGSVLLALRGPAGVAGFLLVAVVAAGTHAWLGSDAIRIGWGFLVTVNQGVVVFTLSRLRGMSLALQSARSRLAELAVTAERLRFARDLNDLLGNALSAISLKAELARQLVDRSRALARHELTVLLALSRQALSDVRGVATAYRERSLDEEVRAARAVLTAANVAVTFNLQPCRPPADVHTTLALALREGVTNVLRHSRAARCQISMACHNEHHTLETLHHG